VSGIECPEELTAHVDKRSCLKGKDSVVNLPKRGTERNRKEAVILFRWILNEGLE